MVSSSSPLGVIGGFTRSITRTSRGISICLGVCFSALSGPIK